MLSTPVRRRFNVIDVLVLILIVAILMTTALRLRLFQKVFQTENHDTAVVSFLISDLAPSAAERLAPEQVLREANRENDYGVIKSVSASAAKRYEADFNGVLHPVYSDERLDMTGVFAVVGTQTERGFFAHGTQLLTAGSTLTLSTENGAYTFLITALSLA